MIGVDLKNADIEADLSTAQGRTAAVPTATEMAGGVVDAVIAGAGIAAPIPKTISGKFVGVTECVTGMLPALEKSAAPRVAVVSSMASLQPVVPAIVDACLAGNEATALAIAGGLAEHGEQMAYLVYRCSKRSLSRWVRRESIAKLLIWLTSEENTHMAGQTIYCDSGADASVRGDDIWSWNDPQR